MKRLLIAFIITLILGNELCAARTIGVVMSGGGAKGLYHIGVLEALEESGIPIDYVGGTSIGAIITGLYATGYSPADMREIAMSGDLERWTSGKIDSNLGSYFRRGSTLHQGDQLLSYRFDPITTRTDTVTRMPRSIISTTQIDMATTELFTPATTFSEGDFDNLMIPFFCIASDITAGEGVVITEGDLGKSIRASMAIPLAFKPIINDNGHILYDGGIYDNFPWRPMRELYNPDLIIGSVCGVDSWSDTKNLSLFDQAFLLAMNPSNYEIDEGGVIIRRNVPTGMLDFDNAEEIIQMGYDDTMAQMDSILAEVDLTTLKSKDYFNKRRRRFNSSLPKLVFDKYKITGLDENHESYIEAFMLTSKRQRQLGVQDKQREMEFDEFKEGLYRILSANEFTTNYPEVNYNDSTERYQISIDLENKPSLKVSIGGNISSTPYNQLYAGVSYKTIDRIASDLFGELYIGAIYSSGRIGYRADFYRRSAMFVDAYYNFSKKNLNHGDFGHLTEVNNTLSTKSSDQFISIGIGRPIRRRGLILLRTNVGSENFKYDNGIPTDISQIYNWGIFNQTRFSYIASKLEVEISTIDNPYFPTKGLFVSAMGMALVGKEKSIAEDATTVGDSAIEKFNTLRADRSWSGAKFTLSKYFNPTKNRYFSLGVSLEGVYTNIPEMYTRTARQLIMPSYAPLAHNQMVYMPEYSAPRYAAAGFMPSIRLWRELYFGGEFHAMLRDKYDDTFQIKDNAGFSIHYISQASLSYNTSIGPMKLAFTKYNIDEWNNLYLTFNFG
ncbi:MAG: patatin-like phospholipase family protein, partial [Rikenellaceae bacterium]